MTADLKDRPAHALVLAIVVIVGGCQEELRNEDVGMSESAPKYHIAVITESYPGDPDFMASFENDDTVRMMSSSDERPDVLVYLNDSPILWLTAGSLWVQCDVLMRQDGRNTVRLEGRRPCPIYAKVVTMNPDGTLNKVVAKRVFFPDDDSEVLEFDIDEAPSARPKPQQLAGREEEIRQLADDVIGVFKSCDANALAEFMAPDSHDKVKGANKQSAAKRRESIVDEVTPIFATMGAGEPEGGDSVKIAIGDRTALFYYDIEPNGQPYLYKWRSATGESVVNPPLLLLRFDDIWCFYFM